MLKSLTIENYADRLLSIEFVPAFRHHGETGAGVDVLGALSLSWAAGRRYQIKQGEKIPSRG